MSSTPSTSSAPSLDEFRDLLNFFIDDVSYKSNLNSILKFMKNEGTFKILIHNLSYIRDNINISHLSMQAFKQLFDLLLQLQFSALDPESFKLYVVCCQAANDCVELIEKGAYTFMYLYIYFLIFNYL